MRNTQEEIEERWREFYLPYTFGELHHKGMTQEVPHSRRKKDVPCLCETHLETRSRVGEDKIAEDMPTYRDKNLVDNHADTLDTYDNPLEEEQYLRENKYTVEED